MSADRFFTSMESRPTTPADLTLSFDDHCETGPVLLDRRLDDDECVIGRPRLIDPWKPRPEMRAVSIHDTEQRVRVRLLDRPQHRFRIDS